MEIVPYLSELNTLKFLLLLTRLTGLVAFFPFFNHQSIPMEIKAGLVFFLTILFFPLATVAPFEPTLLNLAFAVAMELFFGVITGLIVYMVFAILELAGQQISFVMGFTMANVMEPQTGLSVPLIAQFLILIAVVFFLAIDAHHLLLYFYQYTLGAIPLGGFYPHEVLVDFLARAVTNMFLFALIVAFPVVALSYLADFIFGMLMKTMPQFSLLVVGYPIKIGLAYVVMMVVLGAIFVLFKKEVIRAIESLPNVV